MQACIKDVVIHYEMEGPDDAPFITLSHSLAADVELWEKQLPALRGSFRVLRYDTRGHGGSSVPPGPYTMEMLADDVIGLLDHLGIRRTHFLGISMGGMIGQILARRHPDRIEKLVLCDTTGRVPAEMAPVWEERIRAAEAGGMRELAQATMERWLSKEFRRLNPEVAERIRNMILRTPVPGFAGCSRAISSFNFLDELSKISARTLIITGERDETTPVSAARALQDQIRDSKLAVMPGALHLSNIEASELFNRELTTFLNS